MKCLKLIFCLLYFCCSLAEAKEVQVDAQKEVDGWSLPIWKRK